MQCVFVTAVTASLTAGWCAQGKSVQKNQTKGQSQLTGGLVKFGEIYSLKGGWNVQLIKAAYSLDAFACYSDVIAKPNKKLVVIDFAIKNATPREKFFNSDQSLFILVDDQGNKYTWAGIQLANFGVKGFSPNVQPGQGYGQAALHNSLRCSFQVPLDAKITKIMTNAGRLNKQEETLRYLMAGTDAAADPANKIAPLPKGQADSGDATGVVAAPVGATTMGTPVPSGHFLMNVKSVSLTTDAIAPGMFPNDGNKFVIVVMSVKSVSLKDESAFEVLYYNPTLKDSNGNRINAMKIWAASTPTDGAVEHFDKGEERTYRVIFQMAASASPTKFQLNSNTAYCWLWDVSSAK